jgi:N-acetyl-alpha-D-muramate 1-phosphate uridylyltransferase
MSSEPVTRAMIMAAGLGTRMRPLTTNLPKPLVEVRGKPLIDHAIDRLVQAGVKLIVVNVHYRADLLKAHLAKRHDVEIRISDETDVLLGTGGGIVKALPYFEGQPFFVHNSDSIWVEGIGRALPRMQALWNPDEMDALLLLASMVTALGFEGLGDFYLDPEGRVARVGELQSSPFAYPGVQIVHPRIFENAPQGEFSMNRLWDRSIEAGRLFGVRLDGVWMHVGTAEAVKQAEAFLADLAPA